MNFSVLDVHLNLSSKVLVIIVTLLEFEVNKKAVVIVETEKLIARCLISLKLLLKGNGVTAVLNVGGSAVNTVTVLGWHERIDVDLILGVLDLLRVVHAAAVHALVLVFLNINKDVIGE